MRAFQYIIHLTDIPIMINLTPSQAIHIPFNKEKSNFKISN